MWRLLRWFWDSEDAPDFVQAREARTEFGTRRLRTAYGDSVLSPKDPDSEEYFTRDCTRLLQSGAGGTIATIDDQAFEEGDGACTALVTAAISSDGLRWSVKLGGGTEGQHYRYTVGFTTTAGEYLQTSIEFFCANAIN